MGWLDLKESSRTIEGMAASFGGVPPKVVGFDATAVVEWTCHDFHSGGIRS